MRKLATIWLLPLLLLPLAAAAQDSPTLYEVELILFKQPEPEGADAEDWPTNAEEPYADEVVQLSTAGGNYQLLPNEALQLHGIYNRLAQAPQYEPQLHIGWRQYGRPRDDSPWIALPIGWQPVPPTQAAEETDSGFRSFLGTRTDQPTLYGLVRVYEERFIHAQVDLRYRGEPEQVTVSPAAPAAEPALEQPLDGSDAAFGANDWAADDGFETLEPPAPPIYVHRQQRRIRSAGVIHYLDHPVLSAIIQVRRVETANN